MIAALVTVALATPALPVVPPRTAPSHLLADAKGKKAAAPAEPLPPVPTDPPPVGKIKGPGPLDDARKVAEAYLNALSGKGKGDARDHLLGGATLTARDFSIPNWSILYRDEARIEEKPIFGAVKAMWLLDKIGAEALNTVVVAEGDNLELTQEQANKVLGPTREQSVKFRAEFPLFAYIARVGKDVFWHPENPWRREVKKLGKEGNYTLEVHRFVIEEKEAGKPSREWPLRVLRIKTKAYDSGWKILPASDWDPNY
jgi:hypothetical protein